MARARSHFLCLTYEIEGQYTNLHYSLGSCHHTPLPEASIRIAMQERAEPAASDSSRAWQRRLQLNGKLAHGDDPFPGTRHEPMRSGSHKKCAASLEFVTFPVNSGRIHTPGRPCAGASSFTAQRPDSGAQAPLALANGANRCYRSLPSMSRYRSHSRRI